jgi:endonuclease VIII
MPEGDTIYRAARTLNTALAGRIVTRFESGLALLAQIDRAEPIAGRTVESVKAAGKHLLMTFSGQPPLALGPVARFGEVSPNPSSAAKADGLVLRSHMRMNGSWHIYRPGERWQMSPRAMRIRIDTDEWLAVAFNVYVAEFVRSDALHRHRPVAALGPDLLGDFDFARALELMRQRSATSMHEILLDQRIIAGLGNVYKSEILFLSGIHPDTPAGTVSDTAWQALIELARGLLKANVTASSGQGIETHRGLRRTTGRMNPENRLWVYSRSGQPCRKCGTPIASRKDGDAARVTYWCPVCQPTRPE